MSYDFKSLWVEKYRPAVLKDYVCSNTINTYFSSIEEIPNLLFTGTPGIGKTSLAKIIVNDILKCQYLYINASDENGIDTIRNKVNSFAQTKSLDGKIKVIILDESDGLTIDSQRVLRNTMEEYAKLTRFILTANYKYRVIPALQSRCQTFDLTPTLESILKRCIFILKNENIIVPENQKNKFVELVKNNYPDLRKCINELQKNSISGTLLLDQCKNDEILELIFNEIKKQNTNRLRKALIENEQSFNNDYVTLMRNLFNYIDTEEQNTAKKKNYLITLAEFIYRSSFVADQEINCYSCLIKLSEI